MLEKMIRGGMNVARLNMSHATHEWTREVFQRVRAASETAGIPCAIMMDTQGPAIRTGDLPIPLELKPGDIFEFTVKGAQSEEEKSVDVNYPNLVKDIHEGDTVLVDNGVIRLRVLQKLHRRMRCEVLTEGELGSRRHVNLPGVKINMPSITEKDRHDIELGISLGIDFIALSFVRERKDIVELREILSARNSDAKIIAKIEDEQAVVNLVDLIDAADGIMVARGDLGIECPYEELPIIQRRTVKACIRYGKPVIVATHMLESMIENPMPTRAEVTDVANAVYEQTDSVMLSGETTVGKYPRECLEVLDRIAQRIERSGGARFAEKVELAEERQKIVRSAVVMANELKAKGILVFTRYGHMA
jgi:pyruvate kinase